jgi:hypothetical protein
VFEIRVSLDDEMHAALIQDASRHLRPTVYHAKALLRSALGLPFPYPEGFDERDPATWEGTGTCADVKKPASAGNAAGHGAPAKKGILSGDAQS